jgi:hypothetical protein
VIADNPLEFYRSSATGTGVTLLPVYNAAGSGNVWVNESGRSDGTRKEYQTTSQAGYCRSLQYVEGHADAVLGQLPARSGNGSRGSRPTSLRQPLHSRSGWACRSRCPLPPG